MTATPHTVGQRVRSIFDDREGVVIASIQEGERNATLIEFDDYDEDEGVHFKHRKWLPTQHWRAA
jgi:hypothetical protein